MKANVGNVDRMIRLALGVVLIALALFSGMAVFDANLWKYVTVAIGVVLIATAAMRFCALYTVLGIQTCRTTP